MSKKIRVSETKPTYQVVAAVDGRGKPWRVVLSTADREYAVATLEQFKEAGVPVPLDEPPVKNPRNKRPGKRHCCQAGSSRLHDVDQSAFVVKGAWAEAQAPFDYAAMKPRRRASSA
ncbi:hypothetical protein GCM10010869_20930 [Mesorhizobium tianshanense]|nr:hypothetical protein [Mesorhizobium tianshanense]GLS36504.1 hypothetical protein GCM10010869_20930 [Mesorhizobium tianshanense]